ncbi:MASE4 domain-containing protein [Nocardioides solisilvae]|uniref:sensor histidine kinase n=1 Tax=Nocardioides solisilvae TaxID=1542435 RepID=UPI000D750AF0|nr:MASE4 domain-containing protein [Nocardioides solisilvae]
MPSTAVPQESRRGPLVVAAVLPAVTLVLWLWTDTQLAPNPGFMPAFLTLVLAAHLLTSTMLVEHYRAGGGDRLLPLSAAYVWSAVCVTAHALTFPGFFGPQGVLGTPEDSSPWLWLGWNVGFPLLVAAALAPWPASLRRYFARPEGRTLRTLLVHGATAAAALAFVVLATRFVDVLPPMMRDENYGQFASKQGYRLFALNLVALAVALVGVARRGARGGLESWALVAVVASCCDSWLVLTAEARWTLGWYSARALALTAAIIVLMAMLREVTFLYGEAKRHAALMHEHNDTLVEAQTLREHMVAVVSHDMRTPLTGLEGYLEVLAEGDLSPEQADRIIARSRMLATRLALMTEDLLGVATAGRGGLSLQLTEVDVARSLTESAAAFPDLDLRVRATRGLWVKGDPLRLQQVLANLLRNAQNYGAEPVQLDARPVGDRFVQFSVTDAGAGVPEEFVPRLFDAYTRVEGTGRHGSGLGLSVVRDLITAMSGSVHYDALDNTFRVVLPGGVRTQPDSAAPTDDRVLVGD